jgi:creatinine amidohydrolase
LSAQTLTAVLTDIGASVARAGCRKLLFLNSHGGNSAVLDIVTLRLRRAFRMLAVTVSWSRFGYPDALFAETERKHGIHAGDIETSLMLAFRPDLVRENRRDHPPASIAMEDGFAWLNAGRPAGFGWLAQDLSETGAMGDSAAATSAKGEAAADYGATALIELLRDIESFDLANLLDGPLSEA